MNEPFYHYLRNAELVFQNGSRITIYGDQLTEWRVTPDGARGKSEFVAGYMLKDILDPEACLLYTSPYHAHHGSFAG